MCLSGNAVAVDHGQIKAFAILINQRMECCFAPD